MGKLTTKELKDDNLKGTQWIGIVENTDAAIKNQTASSSYKPAILDSGIKINVPPFIESGEKIIIDTRTLEYVKRVN